MDANIEKYIETTFQKIRKLKENEKGEVWLTSDKSGRLCVLKRIGLIGLPYNILKEKNFSLCPHIFHAWEDEGETVIVEEYAHGESLLDRIGRKDYLTEEETKILLLGLCEGLSPIHATGVIHRDITPSNLILQVGNIVKLIDFDAARIIKEHKDEDTHFLGKKGYAPPEQFGYGQTDERSDIYSIGVTFQKALPEDYSGYLTKILAKCAEIDHNKRYQNVNELKRAIIFRSRFEKWGKKLAVAAAVVILAIVLNISAHKEKIIEETPATTTVEPPTLTEKQDTLKEETTTFPVETKETLEPAKTVEPVTPAQIPQYNPPVSATNTEETNAAEPNKTETVMKCPQIIEPPKVEKTANNNFVEELEERNEERELARKKASVKMMINSLPPDWPQERIDRVVKEFCEVMGIDEYP